MGIEAAFKQLIEVAGPVAAGIAVVLLVLIIGMKWSGLAIGFGDKRKLIADTQMDKVETGVASIETKFDMLERRMDAVERGLEGSVKKTEVHALELSFARMEGRFDMMEASTKATAASVSRIEDFLLRISERSGR